MIPWLKNTERIAEGILISYEMLKDKSGDRAGFIYLIKSGRFYKVGRTNDVSTRMTHYSTHNPQTVCLRGYQFFGDSHLMEQILHSNFRPFHHRGEWFVLPKEAVDLVMQIIK